MVRFMNLFSKPFRVFRNGFFCLLVAASIAAPLHGQFKFREPPNRQQPDALDASTGQVFWDWFLLNRAAGIFELEGTLTYRPSGAPSVSYQFLMRGDWQEYRQETLVRLSDESGTSFSKQVITSAGQTIVSDPDGERILSEEEWPVPVIENFPITWMDLLMPYLDWQNVEYLGPDRYLGRPAHRFVLSNPHPDSFPAQATVTLDGDYAAILKADLFDATGSLLKRMRVGGIKKFPDGWMFSELNWEDREARSSIRLKLHSYKSTSR
jgi:hypothetical protein